MEFIVSALGGDGGDGSIGTPGLDGTDVVVVSNGAMNFDGATAFESLFGTVPSPDPVDPGVASPSVPTDFWIL